MPAQLHNNKQLCKDKSATIYAMHGILLHGTYAAFYLSAKWRRDTFPNLLYTQPECGTRSKDRLGSRTLQWEVMTSKSWIPSPHNSINAKSYVRVVQPPLYLFNLSHYGTWTIQLLNKALRVGHLQTSTPRKDCWLQSWYRQVGVNNRRSSLERCIYQESRGQRMVDAISKYWLRQKRKTATWSLKL